MLFFAVVFTDEKHLSSLLPSVAFQVLRSVSGGAGKNYSLPGFIGETYCATVWQSRTRPAFAICFVSTCFWKVGQNTDIHPHTCLAMQVYLVNS